MKAYEPQPRRPRAGDGYEADPPSTITVHERDRSVRLYGPDDKRIVVRRPIGFQPTKGTR